jgi:uncharacterized repeat protein (TIGR03806 family)
MSSGRSASALFLATGLAAMLLVSCGASAPETIAEWNVFVDVRSQTPTAEYVPFEIVAPLFSDYADKHRFVRIPGGTRITVSPDGRWQFPVGTVLVKTFSFGARIIETRLLVRTEDEWEPYVYVWNDDLTEAVRVTAGRRVPVEIIGDDGAPITFDYRVPSGTQCGNCHGGSEDIVPLGPRTGQLDRDGQIERFLALGWLDVDPRATPSPRFADYQVDPAGMMFEQLEPLARSYLDANCAHCHRDGVGGADQSGLFLDIENADPGSLGVCKSIVAAGPASGGRRAVIHPGDPDDSVMVYRMESTEAGVKMPELPTVLAHVEGAALIRAWIAAMPSDDCGLAPR